MVQVGPSFTDEQLQTRLNELVEEGRFQLKIALRASTEIDKIATDVAQIHQVLSSRHESI